MFYWVFLYERGCSQLNYSKLIMHGLQQTVEFSFVLIYTLVTFIVKDLSYAKLEVLVFVSDL